MTGIIGLKLPLLGKGALPGSEGLLGNELLLPGTPAGCWGIKRLWNILPAACWYIWIISARFNSFCMATDATLLGKLLLGRLLLSGVPPELLLLEGEELKLLDKLILLAASTLEGTDDDVIKF